MKRLLPWLVFLAARLLAETAPASADLRFGVMTHFAHGWDPAAWMPALARTETPQVRDELHWAQIERQRGTFTFPESYDRYMAALAQNHIAPLIVLSFENPNYDHGDTPHTDEAIAAFARYAVEILKHYGSQIKAVEVWNEFNGTFAHGPATENRAASYLRLLHATSVAIKRARPDVLVAAGATSGVPLPYWEKLIDDGALDYADALSIHPYRYDTAPEDIEADIAVLQSLVQRNADGQIKPIWVTEIGWFTKPSAAPGDLAIDETMQAKFLTRAFALLLSTGVERVYWYLLHDEPSLPMGMFRDDASRTAKPSVAAFTTLVRQLRGTTFVRREDTAADFYSLVFTRPDNTEMRVVWSLTPTTLSAEGVTAAVGYLGNPIALAHDLHIDDAPVFLSGAIVKLPLAVASVVLADSTHDFSPTQGANGWSYGALARDTPAFTALTDFSATDWTTAWTGIAPFLSIEASAQHPSTIAGAPVAAVRRWESNYSGRVRITGSFRCGTQGDGVGVSVAVDSQTRFQQQLGGGHGNAIAAKFDFIETVRPGTNIDFAVDPGPAGNIDYDATKVSALITQESP